jgi:GWxTD domain-containing protein
MRSHSTIITTAAVIVSAAFILGCATSGDRMKAEQILARAGIESSAGNVGSAVRLARAAIVEDRSYAEPYAFLIELLGDDTIYKRRAAASVAEMWVRALPYDSSAWTTLAELRWLQGFFEGAALAFDRAITLSPDDVSARVSRAELDFTRGRVRNDGYIWDEALDRELHERIGSSFSDDLLLVAGQLAIASGRWKTADSLLTVVREKPPTNPDACFLHIAALVRLSHYDRAQVVWDLLVAFVPPDTLWEYMSPQPLLSPVEEFTFEKMTVNEQENYARTYWAQHDPDPSTPLRERLLEHVARLVVADARFTTPDGRVPGRFTDRGMVYVRWGEPERTQYVRSDPPLWIWSYGNPPMRYTFADEVLSGEFGFAFPRRDRTGHTAETYRERTVSVPESPGHDYVFEPLRVICEALRFPSENGFTRIVVAIAAPATELSFSPGPDGLAHSELLLRGSATDSAGRLVWSDERTLAIAVPSTSSRSPFAAVTDGLSGEVPPGDLLLGVAVVDSAGRRIGVLRFELNVPVFSKDTLSLSDFLLAVRAETTAVDGPFVFDGVRYVPVVATNLAPRSYIVYLEATGLKLDEARATDFEVHYAVARRDGESEVSASYRMHGIARRERLSVSIDLSPLPPGEYELRVRVRDRVSEHTAESARTVVVLQE